MQWRLHGQRREFTPVPTVNRDRTTEGPLCSPVLSQAHERFALTRKGFHGFATVHQTPPSGGGQRFVKSRQMSAGSSRRVREGGVISRGCRPSFERCSVSSLNLGSWSAVRVTCSGEVFATSFSMIMVRTPLREAAYRQASASINARRLSAPVACSFS